MIKKRVFYSLVAGVLAFSFACRHDVQNVQSEKLKNVEILVLDGINGSPVDGTKLKIYERDKLGKEFIVKNGKVNADLKLGSFYDFKLEGKKSLKPYYASSLVTSYLIEENTRYITILQAPLNKITKSTISPEITEIKMENKKIEKWTKTFISELKDVSFTLKSTYPCEEIKHATPSPMMALGYIPSTIDKENIALVAIQANKREGEAYISSYVSHIDPVKINGETEIVIVAYDIAANRIEHHIRIVSNENETQEDETIKIENLKLRLEVYPTPSSTLAIGKDPTTKRSTHYETRLFFDVKKGAEQIDCSSFFLYRKEKTQKDFILVKKIENIASSPRGYQIIDTDGMLEEGKEYSYKIVAFSKTSTRSSYENAPIVSVNITRPSPLILTAPHHNVAIKYSEVKNLFYSFKIAEPQILEDAKYMELGFLLSKRNGEACYASKFKYVFNKKGDDELYFATINDIKKTPDGMYLATEYSKKLSNLTSKSVRAIVDVNDSEGVVTLTKDFITLPINLVAAPFSYKKGVTYYWDIVDWGLVDGLDVSYDDSPCCVVCDGNTEGSAEVIYYFNDKKHGSNALNGREVFSIKY